MIRLSGKKNGFVDLLFFLLGGCLCSLAVNMFTSPNNIAPGGLTGVALFCVFVPDPGGRGEHAAEYPHFHLGLYRNRYKLVGKSLLAVVICSLFIDLGAMIIRLTKAICCWRRCSAAPWKGWGYPCS